jgi:hypothetical protein
MKQIKSCGHDDSSWCDEWCFKRSEELKKSRDHEWDEKAKQAFGSMRLTKEREAEIRYIVEGAHWSDWRKGLLKGLLAEIYYLRTRIKKLRGAMIKHPHDSMAMDYYGIPCSLCKVLAEDDQAEGK